MGTLFGSSIEGHAEILRILAEYGTTALLLAIFGRYTHSIQLFFDRDICDEAFEEKKRAQRYC